ncbi:hypothetical protein ASG14_06000 [Pedobacter sp. Leaf194]|nr:hypothetical protein ASG14_06000 [Pedobacter sp. Leaf194]
MYYVSDDRESKSKIYNDTNFRFNLSTHEIICRLKNKLNYMLKHFLFLSLLVPILSSAQIKITLKISISQKTTDSLFVAGNFNDWNPKNEAFRLKQKDSLNYTIALNLPKGSHDFKITRGSWEKVECEKNGRAIENRNLNLTVDTSMSVNVANWADNFKQVKQEYHYGDHVQVVDSAFFIPQLNKHRQIWIYLPKGYSKSTKKYPVIYMHDGQTLFHANPPRADEWAADSIMDSLIRDGLKEMIIVGIDNDEQDRLKEYNPYDSKYGKGEGKAYVSFLVETLKPFIDAKYRTFKDAKNTAIAGSSMGGLISLYAILKYPEVFGSAGVFSPSFWIAPEIYADVSANLSRLKNNKIFFVAGDLEGSEMIEDMKKVHSILNPDGLNKNMILVEKEDGKHKQWFWHREFVPFLKFIAK